MSDTSKMTKTELLAEINQSWNDFQGYLMSLTPAQVTIPSDAAGWTVLDHVLHLAHWENGMTALMNKQDRATAMGIDAATWNSGDYDRMNGVLQQQTKDMSLQEARDFVMGMHQRFISKIEALSEEDLHRPYNYFLPESPRTEPLIALIYGNTVEHYPEHQEYIEKIVANRASPGKEQVSARVKAGWDKLNTFLASLSAEQKTKPTDAAGWTVKDHMMHLGAWEGGLVALFNKQDRRTEMGIDAATWASGDDPINAVIQKRYKDLSLEDVEEKRRDIHAQLMKQVDSFSDETLNEPYSAFNPNSDSSRPIIDHIIGNTYMHYADHTPWMAAIASSDQITKGELVARVQQGWDDLNAFITGLSDAQKTQPTDPAGWTVKDHIIHLAIWESGLVAFLNKGDRRTAIGVDEATWNSDDDPINAAIQTRYKDLTLDEVQEKRQEIHAETMKLLNGLSEETINMPYNQFNTASDSTRPLAKQIMGDTYMHYAEHIPWMAKIAEGA